MKNGHPEQSNTLVPQATALTDEAPLPFAALLPAGSDVKPGILIVDDEAVVRLVLERALAADGFRVWAAEDGLEALTLYQKHRAEIDLVVLDVNMPGLDGPQTLEALRRADPEVRCCFMSGGSGCYSLRALRQMGAACFFAKPLDLKAIKPMLRRQAHLLAAVRRSGFPPTTPT